MGQYLVPQQDEKVGLLQFLPTEMWLIYPTT